MVTRLTGCQLADGSTPATSATACQGEFHAVVPRESIVRARLDCSLGAKLVSNVATVPTDSGSSSGSRSGGVTPLPEPDGAPGPLGRALIRGEPGHDFLEGFRPPPSEAVFDKPGFSGFYRTDLEQHLRDAGISHLILAGITTQCCVHSTLRDAIDRGFYCLTVADACAAFDPAVHDAVFTVIQAENHLFGWVADTADVIAALA